MPNDNNTIESDDESDSELDNDDITSGINFHLSKRDDQTSVRQI